MTGANNFSKQRRRPSLLESQIKITTTESDDDIKFEEERSMRDSYPRLLQNNFFSINRDNQGGQESFNEDVNSMGNSYLENKAALIFVQNDRYASDHGGLWDVGIDA